ncbi:LOW QUALITY PROTEIN: centrosomal protein of 112 kDa [Neosynchiropus ocellatus]
MSRRNSEAVERLDREFENDLLHLKPYVLKNPDSKDSKRCGQWIKKLCDPTSCNPDIKSLKVRNSYSRLLLQMLRRGHLEAPFTYKPEPGNLKTLPAYLSIYFEEEPSRKPDQQSIDWLTEELGVSADDGQVAGLLHPPSSPTVSVYRQMLRQGTSAQPATSSPLKHSPRLGCRMGAGGLGVDVSDIDSDLEARVNRWKLEVENSQYLPENTVSFVIDNSGNKKSTMDELDSQLLLSRRMELKIKVLEAKHQEDVLNIQQIHDAAIENILERKNGEMDQVKCVYRAKVKELEERNHELEMRAQRTIQESQVIQQRQGAQIAELRKMLDQSCSKDESERKLRMALAEFDQQKVALQQKQSMIIEQLMKEASLRMVKAEAIYEARHQSAERAVHDLEAQLKQMVMEGEKGNALVEQEKAQLEIRFASLHVELQAAINSIKGLQKEKEMQKETYEEMLKRYETKHNNEMDHLHQKHTVSAAKDSEKREVLEKAIADLQQQLLVSEHERDRAARNKDLKSQQEMEELRAVCEKKVSAIQSEAEKERAAAKRAIAKLEDALREKDGQLNRERENQRKQIQQADLTVEKFKMLMDAQEKEYSHQLDDLKKSHKQQMAEQRMQYEQARTRQQEQHCAEKDSLVQERQREVSTLEKEARATLLQHQERTQELKKRDAQTILHLEAQLSSLREDLEVAKVQHEQQVAEMTSRHEEDTQRALLDKEAAMERQRLDMEHICNDLQRKHQDEVQATKKATNSCLKRMEQECSQKLAKSAQILAELRQSICESKEESIREQETMKQRLEDAHIRWDQERTELIQRADEANQALQEKAESLERQLSLSENKLLRKELETEEKVTLVHQEYAKKMGAMIPAEISDELETTITALKSQVDLLQQRNSVLQEELDASRQ